MMMMIKGVLPNKSYFLNRNRYALLDFLIVFIMGSINKEFLGSTRSSIFHVVRWTVGRSVGLLIEIQSIEATDLKLGG